MTSSFVKSVTSPAVDGSLGGDLYLSLRAIDSSGMVVEVSWFPLIWLVWLGGLTVAAGGLFARVGRRTRVALVQEPEPIRV